MARSIFLVVTSSGEYDRRTAYVVKAFLTRQAAQAYVAAWPHRTETPPAHGNSLAQYDVEALIEEVAVAEDGELPGEAFTGWTAI